MHTQPLTFTGADGREVSAWLDLPDGAARALALFPNAMGEAGGSASAVRIARTLTLKGIGVLRFEAKGDGRDDILAAMGCIGGRAPTATLLVGHGEAALGVLSVTADHPEIAAVATIAAPCPAPLEDRIGHLHRPLLILHSPRDEVVPVENAARLFIAARHPKSFLSLDPADHRLTGRADADCAAEILAAWLMRYMPGVPEDDTGPVDEHVIARETRAGKFQVEILAAGHKLLADEPVAVGGLGTGPGPYQLLGAALGACTAMTLRLYATQKDWPLDRVTVRVGHTREKDQVPPDLFSREITVEGPLDEAQTARLIEIADRCPVHRTLEAGSRVMTALMDAPTVPAVEAADQHELDMQAACVDP